MWLKLDGLVFRMQCDSDVVFCRKKGSNIDLGPGVGYEDYCRYSAVLAQGGGGIQLYIECKHF